MAEKFVTHKCNWKLDDTGYTFEEASTLKLNIDLRNANSTQKPKYGDCEIVSDPRGGYMVRCKQISN